MLGGCDAFESDAEGRLRSVMSIALGDCLNDASADAQGADENALVFNMRQLDCADPHQYEVYHLHQATNGVYPGAAALEALADKVCEASFQRFVGRAYDDSALDFSALWPSEDGWRDERDREIVCLLSAMDESLLAGSMRGSKR